jgi:hypothetical protein
MAPVTFVPAKRDLLAFFGEKWNNRIDSVPVWEWENRTTAFGTATNKQNNLFFQIIT